MTIALEEIEAELKKRWVYPYKWGSKQTNFKDIRTNFIYQISSFEILLEEVKKLFLTLFGRLSNRHCLEDVKQFKRK